MCLGSAAQHFFQKSISAELSHRFSKELELVSSHRFRSWDDLHFAYFYAYYQIAKPKRFCTQVRAAATDCPRHSDFCLRLLNSKEQAKESLQRLINFPRTPRFLNINDHVTDADEQKVVSMLFKQYFLHLFPKPSSFEATNCLQSAPPVL